MEMWNRLLAFGKRLSLHGTEIRAAHPGGKVGQNLADGCARRVVAVPRPQCQRVSLDVNATAVLAANALVHCHRQAFATISVRDNRFHA
jgi:hypothetical protein